MLKCKGNEAHAFDVLTVQVDGVGSYQLIHYGLLPMLDGEVNRCGALIVDEVWISTGVEEQLQAISVALAGCVEKRSLAEAIGVIDLHAALKEQADDQRLIVAGSVEQARLTVRILERHIALGFLDQPLCHLQALVDVLDAHGYEERVLAER